MELNGKHRSIVSKKRGTDDIVWFRTKDSSRGGSETRKLVAHYESQMQGMNDMIASDRPIHTILT